MSAENDFAHKLMETQPDRFTSVISEAPSDIRLSAISTALQIATLVRATRASYILLVEDTPIPEQFATSLATYLALHISGALGHTGRLEVVEQNPKVATAIQKAAKQQALSEHVHVHSGNLSSVIHGLNGPYDLAILSGGWSQYEHMQEDITRLLRVGGSLTVINTTALAEASEDSEANALRRFLVLLAADERYLLSTGLNFAGVIAARIH
ncbi:MAG TPA: hypothetical protein DGL25_00125 [Dehalococcoidia bacterium]|nr:hypothetical protein [Dehalococcoidia bacterium]|tara:strand:+ start:555 stop:1187 length:633 start_codon:yes stop_codon:yes gene_type:complete